MAAVEFEDPAGDIVEKIAVVGDRDHGAWKVLQEAFQPGNRLGVEMVGGLVENQHVGIRQQQPAQRDAALLAPRQVGDRRVPRRQAQRVGGDLQLAVQVPGTGGFDFFLQFGLLCQQLIHLVVGHRFGEFHVHLVERLEQSLGLGDPELDVAAHIETVVQFRLLRQVTDANTGLRTGLTVVLLVDAGHDAQQGRFAGAVVTQHADLGAGEEIERDVLEDLVLRRHDLADSAHREYVLRH